MPIMTHAISIESNAPLREESDAGAQQPMFPRKQARSQRRGRVAGDDGYLDLCDHRPAIKLGRYKMHARPMHKIAICERALVRL